MMEGLFEALAEALLEPIFEMAIEIGSEKFSQLAGLGREMSFTNFQMSSDKIITLDILNQNKEIL